MAFRNLDANHDWVYGTSRNAYVTENQEIALNIETRILSFLGNCFFDTDAGIDWWNLLDYNKREKLENAVQDTIIQTPGVTGINSVDVITGANRQLRISYDIQTIYSESYTAEITPVDLPSAG